MKPTAEKLTIILKLLLTATAISTILINVSTATAINTHPRVPDDFDFHFIDLDFLIIGFPQSGTTTVNNSSHLPNKLNHTQDILQQVITTKG